MQGPRGQATLASLPKEAQELFEAGKLIELFNFREYVSGQTIGIMIKQAREAALAIYK